MRHRLRHLHLVAVLLVLVCPLTGWAQEKPTLFLVSAGISNYADPAMNLANAAKDAGDMANAFRKQEGKLFAGVFVDELIDTRATGDGILKAIGKVAPFPRAKDFTVVHLAGHGGGGPATGLLALFAPGKIKEYCFCAHDRDLKWSELKPALRQVGGTVILILDSCHAAAATGSRNAVVLAGCAADKWSYEDQEVGGNGWYTKVIVDGLAGKADANGDGIVTLDELHAYAAGTLNRINEDKHVPYGQVPELILPESPPGTLPLALWKLPEPAHKFMPPAD